VTTPASRHPRTLQTPPGYAPFSIRHLLQFDLLDNLEKLQAIGSQVWRDSSPSWGSLAAAHVAHLTQAYPVFHPNTSLLFILLEPHY
jgi:hypothetical protein